MITKVTFVGTSFTRKPPKYERFIRPTGLRFTKAHVTHPELKCTFNLEMIGVKKNPNGPMYTSLGVVTRGTIIEVTWTFLIFVMGWFGGPPFIVFITNNIWAMNIRWMWANLVWLLLPEKLYGVRFPLFYFFFSRSLAPFHSHWSLTSFPQNLLVNAGKYAQVTNNPENDGCINAVLLV